MVARAALTLHIAGEIALLAAFGDGRPFVVLPFALGQGQLDLGQAPTAKVQPQGHQRKAPLFELDRDPVQLGLVQQALALARRVVPAVPGHRIGRDLGPDEPAFALFQPGIGAAQVGRRAAQRLDLAAT